MIAGQPFTTGFCGDASLSERPMGRIRAPLEMMGAGFAFPDRENHAPFRLAVHGGLPFVVLVPLQGLFWGQS